MDLAAELEHLLEAFEARHVDYALAGGLALAVHGVVRATEDIGVPTVVSECRCRRVKPHGG